MVKLILYNIEYLEGYTGKKLEYLKFWRRIIHPKDIEKKLVESLSSYNPDIVAFTEFNTKSITTNKNYLAYFKKELGMEHFVSKLQYKFPGLKYTPLFNRQSLALFSKKKMSETKTHYLKRGMKRSVLQTSIHVPQKITLLLTHLALGKESRKDQLNELAELIKKIEGNVILLGDLNTVAGEKEIKQLQKETHLKHSFKLKPHSRVYTFPAYHPRKKFDYVLTSKNIKVNKYEVLKTNLSDHLPILVDFEVK